MIIVDIKLDLKFKEKWSYDNKLEDYRKQIYYNDMMNPNLENKKYHYLLNRVKIKINNFLLITTNLDGLHRQIW